MTLFTRTSKRKHFQQHEPSIQTNDQAPHFPTITASVSSTYQANLNSLLGLLFTCAGFGGIFGPWLVGVASDLGGLKFGFSLNLVFGLLKLLLPSFCCGCSRKMPIYLERHNRDDPPRVPCFF
jgi:MFS family permease